MGRADAWLQPTTQCYKCTATECECHDCAAEYNAGMGGGWAI
jgi:hypothetical protein